ncbi:MAG TPA: 4Fe-4S ferredoxin [bacterium]|nr:4Fe-4S ferredoxin [bacterium]
MKRLVIDIPALAASGTPADAIRCEYLFHRKNAGPNSVIEVAEFASYCRQCRDAFCVAACPKEALERQESGLIKRYNMRCVGCKSCVLACPFGTIFPEVINYITAHCDLCLNQLSGDPDYLPLCVRTAPEGTFTMQEIAAEDPGNHLYFVGDHLAVKSPGWRQKEGKA